MTSETFRCIFCLFNTHCSALIVEQNIFLDSPARGVTYIIDYVTEISKGRGGHIDRQEAKEGERKRQEDRQREQERET